MRPKGPKVQKCAVSSGILANVKFLGGGGGRVQCAGAAGHDIALSVGGMGISVGGMGISIGGMEFSVGGIGFSVAGIEKSTLDFLSAALKHQGQIHAPGALYIRNFSPRKNVSTLHKCTFGCARHSENKFSLCSLLHKSSATRCFALNISTKVTEGFENRTLQHGSAKTRHFPPQKKAARPPFDQSSQPALCTLNG